MGKLQAKIRGFCIAGRQWVLTAACCLLVVGASSIANATDPPPLIPDTGIDYAEMLGEVGTALGSPVAVVMGLFFAFMIARVVMKWGKRVA